MSPSRAPEIGSVSFVPLPARLAVERAEALEASELTLVERLLGEFGERLQELARRIRRVGRTEEGAVVLLTGCGRNSGCTALALALALSAAEEMPVLLVDGDLEKPQLSRALLQTPELGWEEAVRGQCSFQRPLFYLESQRRLALLPLKQPVAVGGELTAKPALRIWLTQLRQDFGLIVVDGGPVLEAGRRWAPHVDTALLLSDARRTATEEWAPAWDCLEEEGTHVLGIVETFV